VAETESDPTAAVPTLVEQLAESPVPVRTQTPLGVKVTLPVGVLVVPGDVSVTVAEQLVDWPIVGVDGVHVTDVKVSRLLIVTKTMGLVLARCSASPP